MRYKAEALVGDSLVQIKRDASKYYEEAKSYCLPAANPVRLTLILNMSVFYYEICYERPKGLNIAETGLQAA